MLKTTDILDTINERLVTRWPDRTVYVDVCPIDFDRPSFWLAVEKNDMTDANRFMVRRDLQVRLTLYDQLDEHYEASWYRLAGDVDNAKKLLMTPLAVSDSDTGRVRHLSLTLKALPRDPDRAYIQINTSWMDERPGIGEEKTTPVADSYEVRVRGTIK